jgi:hypothetical protein
MRVDNTGANGRPARAAAYGRSSVMDYIYYFTSIIAQLLNFLLDLIGSGIDI